MTRPASQHGARLPVARGGWRRLGAGLVTGAADDDPSGIATYSQVGTQFGYSMLWTTVATVPLMIGIQTICAHIARVTGRGLAANLTRILPRGVVAALVGLLVVNNVVNLAADIGAMGDALAMLTGGHARSLALLCAAVSLLLEVFIPFRHYAPILKILTASLLAYVVTACVVGIPWRDMLVHWLPERWDHRTLVALTAVFGTTVSPYLFFWQAAEEVEQERADPHAHALLSAPENAPAEFRRIRIDTDLGMTYSNLVAFFIIVTTAATLHASGITRIETATQAAEALRPVGGPFAFALFALGIIGTGLLAVPVLAGSAAYAVADVFKLPGSLELPFNRAIGFYAIVAAATLGGAALAVTSIDPIAMLFWTAVVNGVVAVPIIVAMMVVATSKREAKLTLPRWLIVVGWFAAALMTGVVGMLIWTSL